MADKKISELTSAISVNTTDFFPIVQAGTTLKLDFGTLLSHLPSQPQTIQAAESPVSGVISTAIRSSLITSAVGAVNYTLGAGTHGLQKVIAAPSMGGAASAIVTVTGGVGFTTLSFTAAGQTIELENISGSWYVVGVRGATIA